MPHSFSHFEWPVEFVAGGCRIRFRMRDCGGRRVTARPNLYTVTAQLLKDGQVVAERMDRVGIRKVEVDRTETAGAAWAPEAADGGTRRVDAPPDPASHFVFRVNDVPIMVKAAHWVRSTRSTAGMLNGWIGP